MGGYFDNDDLVYGKEGKSGEYLYINVPTYEGTVGTMMHELQHLINYYNNAIKKGKDMDIWLNEALSESTSYIFSKYKIDERKVLFNDMPSYYSFYSWYTQYDNNEYIFSEPYYVLISYGSASIFMNWINTKTGGNYN
ncbi:hypothetical protein E6A50_02265, partial [Brachyspira hampsonii]|nr:hypothetical protein [Brachyspira hampsonii]MBW5409195.1 hypothetical protein [Brachyspira hampsonii]